ncbi:hypothetical protein [Paracoccus methylarcula]|uniref:Uncharacterized protein n=1 Tax=Paracoccus methylarcula TaxID=72022 RepID=A0A3R7LP81_9RHOB|nr:hypothetical protein [Paracoccus methylarcula]RNF34064.1 hypothetical protein A7A09_014320 [Paracoccus methylarcula]
MSERPISPLPIFHRDIEIRRTDVPWHPYIWSHDESDGHGTAWTVEEARNQIDAHLVRMAEKQS